MEIRVSNDSVEITGYVNAVGRESSPLRSSDGYFTETIQPGAFDRALRDNPNIPMLLNHDETRVIASGDSLDLREDPVGLHVRAVITDAEVVDKAANDRLAGWSFGFVPLDQSMDTREGCMPHRTVKRMALREVSLLDDTKRPAYPATSVYTRDDGADDVIELRYMAEDAYIEDKREVPEEVDDEPPDLMAYRAIIEELGTL